MGLVDLFRPKWKHSDAEVRATAVRELGADEADVIITIAKSDSDAGVRRIAIKKLDDPGVLGEIAVSDPDESLRQIAEEKASSILLSTACGADQAAATEALDKINDQRALADVAKQASQKDLRAAAAGRLTDQKALADVARNAKELSIRLEALRQITDVPVLRSIALNDERKEIALAALGGIEEREALEAIAHKGKNKAVRGQARKKLQALAPDQRPVDKRVQTRREKLCQTVEVLCRATDWEATGRRLEELQREWDGLEGDADDEQQARFSGSCETFFSRLVQHQKERAERAREEQQLREVLGERVTVCEEAEALAAGPASEAIPGELERLRQRWEELDPIPDAHRDVIEQRFATACEGATARHEGWKAAEGMRGQLEGLCARAEAVAASGHRDTRRQIRELQDEWRQIRAPREGELYERFSAAAEQLDRQESGAKERQEKQKLENQQRQEDQKLENQQRLESLCDRLETKVDTDNLKVADRLLKDAQAAIKRTGDLPTREAKDQLIERLKAGREKLYTRAEELREVEEWKQWSMVPKLEALCEEVEGLAKVEDLKEVSKRLRKAQGRWKKVGTAPRSKSESLWKRFKAACDKAYERCQVVFEQSEQERDENLKLKEGLCEKVEALQDSESFNETATAIKQLQVEWKDLGPVPRAKSDAVWQRFRKACDHFFDRRQQHLEQEGGQRDENLKLKDGLCEQVEALQDDESWDETGTAIKRVQAQWKEIGPVPRAKSKAIWARFRKACDHFFDRRQEHLDEGRMEALQRKEELCQRIEALAQPPEEGDPATEAPEPDQVVSAIFEARAMWKEIGPVPRSRSDEIWNRFNGACERVVEVHPKFFKGTELDPEANLRRKEELCQQVEALIEANTPVAPPPPADPAEPADPAGSVEAMAERLREALAANALGAGAEDTKVAPDWATAAREVKGLQESWKKLGPVPGEPGEAVWNRFRAACDHVFAQLRPDRKRPEAPKAEDGKQEENFKLKLAICEEAEALAAAEDPTEHREAIRELRRKWKAAGLVPKAQARKLWNRFRQACNKVMSEGRREEEDDQQGTDAPAEAAEAAPAESAPAEAASAESAPAESAPAEAAPAEAAPVEGPADASPAEVVSTPTVEASPEEASAVAANGWDESLDDGWDDVLLPDNSDTEGEEETRGVPGTSTGEE
jgi:hypothetical protein